MSILPQSGRGRRTAEKQRLYDQRVKEFCGLILEINSRIDFRVSSRGWCYQLEEHGLGKGDFDRAQKLINECRKNGMLPLDICADDGARAAGNLEIANADASDYTPEEYAHEELEYINDARRSAIESAGFAYRPWGFWYDKDVYIEMLVEKIDLKELFRNICLRFRIPIANGRGWPDINSRAAMMRRFMEMEQLGKQCVLLYCGDHDPAGLNISESLRAMYGDLSLAVGWHPDNLIIDRFGLNYDFIEEHKMSWIDGLETGSGRRLDDPRHSDHFKPYVQDYLADYGARKVEANALVTRAEAGRKLCLDSISKYLSVDTPERYQEALDEARKEVHGRVLELLEEQE